MSESTLDWLTVHFKEQKEIGIVHGSLRFFKDIIQWAGGFNTDKQRSFEKYIMTHHGINIRKIPRNGTNTIRYIDFSDGSGSYRVLKYVYSTDKNVKKFTSCYHTLSILMNWGIFLLLVISNGNCESRQFTKQYFFSHERPHFLLQKLVLFICCRFIGVGIFNNTYKFYAHIINRSCNW